MPGGEAVSGAKLYRCEVTTVLYIVATSEIDAIQTAESNAREEYEHDTFAHELDAASRIDWEPGSLPYVSYKAESVTDKRERTVEEWQAMLCGKVAP
jgi:hypothetical protein